MRFAKLVALSAVLLCAVTTSGYAATGAERHVAKGVKCEICHGPDKANPQLPTIDNCKTCHDIKALVEKTKTSNRPIRTFRLTTKISSIA